MRTITRSKKKSKIGNFGETIVFSVSSSKILTPKDMKRTVSARWEQHKILGKAPKSEFVGQKRSRNNNDRSVICRAWSKARSTLGKIEKAIKAGTVNWLVIGGNSSEAEDVHFFLFRNLGRDLEQRGTGKSNRKPYLCGIHIRR